MHTQAAGNCPDVGTAGEPRCTQKCIMKGANKARLEDAPRMPPSAETKGAA